MARESVLPAPAIHEISPSLAMLDLGRLGVKCAWGPTARPLEAGFHKMIGSCRTLAGRLSRGIQSELPFMPQEYADMVSTTSYGPLHPCGEHVNRCLGASPEGSGFPFGQAGEFRLVVQRSNHDSWSCPASDVARWGIDLGFIVLVISARADRGTAEDGDGTAIPCLAGFRPSVSGMPLRAPSQENGAFRVMSSLPRSRKPWVPTLTSARAFEVATHHLPIGRCRPCPAEARVLSASGIP